MSFDLQKVLDAKRAIRRDLATLPIAEKLRMLDALRERELAIRGSDLRSIPAVPLRETPPAYRAKPK